MKARTLKWWGFSLRNPRDFPHSAVSRPEALTILFFSGLVLESLWFGVLYTSLYVPPKPWIVYLPVWVLGGLFLAGVLLPSAWRDRLPGAAWLVLARERGHGRSWDWLIGLGSLVLLGVLVARLRGPLFWAGLGVGGALFFGVLCLFLYQTPVNFVARRRCLEFPGWLPLSPARNREEPLVDPEADPVFSFWIKDQGSPLGVRIPEEELVSLRNLNADGGGKLFLHNPPAVVLQDRPPVSGIGQETLVRFCRQIADLASPWPLTPLQLANSVLFFVQKSFSYVLDEDSTGVFPKGPFPEYGRFPLETLKDQRGDCECTAILAVSLLTYLGFDAALLFMAIKDSDSERQSGHCAVGLNARGAFLPSEAIVEELEFFTDKDGNCFLYGETAIDVEMAFGSIPELLRPMIVPESQEVVRIPQPKV